MITITVITRSSGGSVIRLKFLTMIALVGKSVFSVLDKGAQSYVSKSDVMFIKESYAALEVSD